MKAIIKTTLIVAATLMISCKSTQQVPFSKVEVTQEDFIKVDTSDYPDAEAVMISEELYIKTEGVVRPIWKTYTNQFSTVWQTTAVDKVLFLSDNADETSNLYYYYPQATAQDLLINCDMWLYNLDDRGRVVNRQLNKEEIDISRLDDSTGIVQIKVDEPLKGKILLRKYTLFSPYYPKEEVSSTFVKYLNNPDDDFLLRPIIFQKQIPLLYGKYQISLRDWWLKRYGIKQLGAGDIDVLYSKTKEVTNSFFAKSPNWPPYKGTSIHYKVIDESRVDYNADMITIYVSNLNALSPNSDEEPVGIEFVNILREFIEREKR